MIDRSRHGRLFYCLISLALALALGISRPAAAANTTTVQDVVYRADGTPASGTLVISWGSSQLARIANNYFGIKALPDGETVELPTLEYVGGAPVRVAAKFASFASMAECFRARDRVIASLAACAEARAAAHDPEAFVRAFARHWATDPNYAEKVLAIYRSHALDKLDEQSPVASSKSPVAG
jgi:Mannosyl-glycoprotein endo-beta-N-acetylglucosaminidase